MYVCLLFIIFIHSEAYLASENAGAADTPANAPAAPETNIPDELICSLCRDLLTDAVMIPCCGNSFCDECMLHLILVTFHLTPACDISPFRPVRKIVNVALYCDTRLTSTNSLGIFTCKVM